MKIICPKSISKFKLKNLGKYHNLYLQSNTSLLVDVFENVRNKCTRIIILSAPRLSWQVCFEKTGVELEILINNDMLMMVEKGITGRICHAIYSYAKANNKYMKNYNKNIELSYLMNLDAKICVDGECSETYL